MVHCSQRGSEMICGEMSHTFLFEQGGPAQVWQVHHRMFHKELPNIIRQHIQHEKLVLLTASLLSKYFFDILITSMANDFSLA